MIIRLNNKKLTELPPLSTETVMIFCGDNQLTKLPPLSFLNELQVLNCESNELTELPSLPNQSVTLRALHFNDNLIQKIDNLPNSLRFFSCDNNPMTQIPLLPRLLEWIKISPWQGISCLNNLTNPKTLVFINN